MKLTKFAKLVKRDGYLSLNHVEGSGLWLGTQYCLFKADGLPESTDRDSIMAILDFDDKAAKNITVEEKSFASGHNVRGIDISDGHELGSKAQSIEITIGYQGRSIGSLKCDDGRALLYDETILEPIANLIKDNDYGQITVRQCSGVRYIMIHDGLVAKAAVMPLHIGDGKFLDGLSYLADRFKAWEDENELEDDE